MYSMLSSIPAYTPDLRVVDQKVRDMIKTQERLADKFRNQERIINRLTVKLDKLEERLKTLENRRSFS